MTDEERDIAWDELVKMIIRGVTLQEAAGVLGVHVQTIYKWTHNPAFKIKLARTRALVMEKSQCIVEETAIRVTQEMESLQAMIARGSRKALETLIDKLESQNEHIQVKAAVDLADRNPETSKTKKVQQTNLKAVITAEQLAVLARAAREIDEVHGVKGNVLPVEASEVVEEAFVLEDSE